MPVSAEVDSSKAEQTRTSQPLRRRGPGRQAAGSGRGFPRSVCETLEFGFRAVPADPVLHRGRHHRGLGGGDDADRAGGGGDA